MTVASPVMLVVAGPSGSGKSRLFPVAAFGFASFNVDDRCRELHGTYLAIPPHIRSVAQRECEAFIAGCTAAGASFAVETTLRSDIAVQQAMSAKLAGFVTHAASLRNLRFAARVFDLVLVYDNSADGAEPVLVAELHGGALVTHESALPAWLREALAG